MAEGFTDVWRTVRLYVPVAPLFLVQDWVNEAWKTLARTRPWSFLRGELALTINAARTVASVTVTRGSATVTSVGLFVASDNGRTFRISTYPHYTIVAFVDVNTITLDRVYGEDDGTASAEIYDGYAIMPADFGSFRIIVDPYIRRRLAFWITEDQLNLLDPIRQTGDSGPRVLVASSPSPHPLTLGRIRYEYWPRPTANRSYPALYNKQADSWVNGELFSGVLADGKDALVKGALAQAARWPGSGDVQNPYFNLALSDRLETEFQWRTQQLGLRDDEHYGDDLQRVHWERWPRSDLSYNDQSLRATDATIADLY